MIKSYKWDIKKEKLIEYESGRKQDGIIFRPRIYHNITSKPVYVESRSQLKNLLKKYNKVELG